MQLDSHIPLSLISFLQLPRFSPVRYSEVSGLPLLVVPSLLHKQHGFLCTQTASSTKLNKLQ